jgi:hypothetical protein
MTTVATKPGLLDKLCVARDEKVGIYGFVFNRDGEWHEVIIDDQLFIVAPRWEALTDVQQALYHGDRDMYEKVGRKGSKTLYFARSEQNNETWVPLIEKAFAKFHGDYQSLHGGDASEGIEDLTGGISESLYLNDILDTDLFWEKELMRANQDLLFSCSVKNPKSVPVFKEKIKGIITEHAYAILKCVNFRGKKFMKIRNPWGESEWTGRWSDGSKEWDDEWLDALKMLGHTFGDDGVFIMEYSDFLEHFESIERTQLFDETWVQSSHWLNVRTRPPGTAWQFGDISFTFCLPEQSDTVLVLSQSNSRYYRGIPKEEWSFDFKLYKVGSKEIKGSSNYSTGLSRSVTLRINLPAGEYVVHVRLDREYPDEVKTVDDDVLKLEVKEMIEIRNQMAKSRKTARVLSQMAESNSIAANFDVKDWQDRIVVPLEIFAGQDLLKVLVDNLAKGSERRKLLQTRIAAMRMAHQKPSDATEPPREEPAAEATPKDNASDKLADVLEKGGEEVNLEGAPQADHAAEDDTNRTNNRQDDSAPTHAGIFCDNCNLDKPRNDIVGYRWKCTVCMGYDLCDECYLAGAHDEHLMVKIEHPADVSGNDTIFDPNSTVLLGFRVYSKSRAAVQIAGQLANGQVVPWKRNDADISMKIQ